MPHHIRVRAGAVIMEKDSILLIEFNDENGLHYNLPAGGAEPGETVREAAVREAKEEASVDVEAGPLAFVYEYAPHTAEGRFGETHSLCLMFECLLKEGSQAKLPENPDSHQTGVRWVKLSELHEIILYPNIKEHILKYAHNKRNLELIEEHKLGDYSADSEGNRLEENMQKAER
ncbi:NUDIX domain-containing protein [Bacillus sp. UMB0728]|uniref:NUDIX domain-containing protein n=1 Tax=Bacillus sp. UMB0728 TaxID=2066052 RepID=UPI000C77433C|nr:NUDIX domain-containing protein [Bacillus sp. UMB0728]PLR74831.1 NUDIX hydrolase [Bacillus sp. UMB0728]